ncbi:MAG TPA: hypothetical protein VNK81_07870 [Thermodesulfobacteriota bacterium]|jgi:hypothetical protein|nr:hypothetical protein [Thermodesulfobacteriota bacterium]
MKTMSREALDKLVNDHFMYKATDDVEGVLQTLMEGAGHELVGGSYGPLLGKAAIGRFYEHLFPCLKDGRVEPVMRLYGDDFLIDESIWIGHLIGVSWPDTIGM